MLIYLLQFWYKKFPPATFQQYHAILEVHFPYYRALNADLKPRFLSRLHILLKFITFIPNNMPEVRPEMKIIIGSAIIQVTFGLKRFILKFFTTIYVVPRPYNFTGFPNKLLGHVDLKEQVVCLSWHDVQHGFHVADDAVNVALHEVAHCLEAENRFRAIFQEFFNRIKYYKWRKVAFRKLAIMQKGQHQFLKDYGAQNMSELFAVCIEAFFEQPEQFKQQLPPLYAALSDLLHQDPTRKEMPLI